MKPIDFIKILISDHNVGALTISSSYAAKSIASSLKRDSKYIIEYGSGNGVVTKEILKHIPKDGKILAFELNRLLYEDFKKNINDSRVLVRHEDVIDVVNHFSAIDLPQVDCVVSGVPFTFFKAKEREAVIKRTHDVLAPEGRLIIYQHTIWVLPILKKYFKKIRIKYELRNILPYVIIIADK